MLYCLYAVAKAVKGQPTDLGCFLLPPPPPPPPPTHTHTHTHTPQFLKEGCGESRSLDPHKSELEYSALCKFQEILPGCVPHPYILDRNHKASRKCLSSSVFKFILLVYITSTISSSVIMEDLLEFHKLEDELTRGVVEEHTSAIEAAMACVGRVHRTTWLDSLPIRERKELIERFEWVL